MQSSTATQKYSEQLSAMDESIKVLTVQRAQLLADYRQSQLSDILAQDGTWLADAKASPRDWAHLLNSRTDDKEWRAQVALEGVTGRSLWAYSDERAITFAFYTELPQRQELYAWLIEEMMPFITPWNRSAEPAPACGYVSIYNEGYNLLLGKTPQGTWAVEVRGGRELTTYTDLRSALKDVQKIAARSFFRSEC